MHGFALESLNAAQGVGNVVVLIASTSSRDMVHGGPAGTGKYPEMNTRSSLEGWLGGAELRHSGAMNDTLRRLVLGSRFWVCGS